MIALVTAIYGGWDDLKAFPEQDTEVDAVCVTDDPDLTSDQWRIVYQPRPGVHPNRAAKIPRLFPWLYTEADCSVWLDASFDILTPSFARDAMEPADPIAQMPHPNRDCIYDEAVVTLRIPKYADEPIAEQVAHYRESGHPEHWGLWHSGLIARRHTEAVKLFGLAWSAEIARWSFQDQLSAPVVLARHRLRPAYLPDHWLHNNVHTGEVARAAQVERERSTDPGYLHG